MSRLLIVLVLILVGVLGLGFYMKWFGVASDSADGKSKVTFTVDTDRIHADEKKVLDAAHDLGHQTKDKVTPPQN